ncbi:MAG TPA: phage portal protein [Firmicutes bacterium]|nr:phage portal protein [Bacillota bacterium]
MLFRRLVRNMATTVTTSQEAALNDPALLEWLGIEPDEIDVRGTKALREATVFACVKILSEAVAKLPLKVYRETDRGIEKATGHYLYPLLKSRPNPYMTAYDMFKAVEAQRNLHGNAYIVPEIIQSGLDRGKIRWLWPVDAKAVEIWIDNRGLFEARNRVWYVVRVGGQEIRLDPEEIVHLRAMTLDGISGVSPLQYLRWTVESGLAGTKHVREFFRQGLQMKGIVHYTGDLNEEAERRFRERFERMAAGLKNAHRVALLPIGYQFQPLELSMTDAQFLETAQLTIRQIANAFGVKMHQLNDLSRATHTNIEEQQKQFYADTLQAILTQYEQEFTYKLFTPSEIRRGYYVKFVVDSILRSDIKTRYEAYRIGIQGSFLKPNEVRAWEELPAEPGGDNLLVNKAMQALTSVVPVKKEGGEEQDEQQEALLEM